MPATYLQFALYLSWIAQGSVQHELWQMVSYLQQLLLIFLVFEQFSLPQSTNNNLKSPTRSTNQTHFLAVHQRCFTIFFLLTSCIYMMTVGLPSNNKEVLENAPSYMIIRPSLKVGLYMSVVFFRPYMCRLKWRLC